jgi:NAD(P)-dependent dehydrogenase (short-subunit alcohol dehydrogenase family)
MLRRRQASTPSTYMLLVIMLTDDPIAMMYGLTRSLKNEIVRLAPGARVNCVAPGWTRTPMAAAALADPKVIYTALATCVSFAAQAGSGR